MCCAVKHRLDGLYRGKVAKHRALLLQQIGRCASRCPDIQASSRISPGVKMNTLASSFAGRISAQISFVIGAEYFMRNLNKYLNNNDIQCTWHIKW